MSAMLMLRVSSLSVVCSELDTAHANGGFDRARQSMKQFTVEPVPIPSTQFGWMNFSKEVYAASATFCLSTSDDIILQLRRDKHPLKRANLQKLTLSYRSCDRQISAQSDDQTRAGKP